MIIVESRLQYRGGSDGTGPARDPDAGEVLSNNLAPQGPSRNRVVHPAHPELTRDVNQLNHGAVAEGRSGETSGRWEEAQNVVDERVADSDNGVGDTGGKERGRPGAETPVEEPCPESRVTSIPGPQHTDRLEKRLFSKLLEETLEKEKGLKTFKDLCSERALTLSSESQGRSSGVFSASAPTSPAQSQGRNSGNISPASPGVSSGELVDEIYGTPSTGGSSNPSSPESLKKPAWNTYSCSVKSKDPGHRDGAIQTVLGKTVGARKVNSGGTIDRWGAGSAS